MYAAILNRKLVLAINEAEQVSKRLKKLNQESCLCPSCKHRIILILSEEKKPFFKHFYQVKGTGEKGEHLQAKQLLCTTLKVNGIRADVEVPLLDQQSETDILVENNLSSEVQCAPLNEAEFTHRHALYKKLQIRGIRVARKKHYLKNKINHSQKIFLRYSMKWQWYYLGINSFSCAITLKYNILMAVLSSELSYSIKTFSLGGKGMASLFTFIPSTRRNKLSYIQDQKVYLQKRITQKSKLGLEIAPLLHQLHYSVTGVPNELFLRLQEPKEKSPILIFLRKGLADSRTN